MPQKIAQPRQKSAAQALRRLEKGNANFVNDELSHQLQDVSRRSELKKGQSPWAIVVTCADSRVVPELIFDTGIGELFVVRVAGNVANTSTLASVEYAVHNLGVKLIVVLGHEGCGAVKAALDGNDLGYNLNHLLAHIKPAIEKPFKMKGNRMNEAVERNALCAAQQLPGRSEIIRNAQRLKVVPAIYRLATGEVDYLSSQSS